MENLIWSNNPLLSILLRLSAHGLRPTEGEHRWTDHFQRRLAFPTETNEVTTAEKTGNVGIGWAGWEFFMAVFWKRTYTCCIKPQGGDLLGRSYQNCFLEVSDCIRNNRDRTNSGLNKRSVFYVMVNSFWRWAVQDWFDESMMSWIQVPSPSMHCLPWVDAFAHMVQDREISYSYSWQQEGEVHIPGQTPPLFSSQWQEHKDMPLPDCKGN